MIVVKVLLKALGAAVGIILLFALGLFMYVGYFTLMSVLADYLPEIMTKDVAFVSMMVLHMFNMIFIVCLVSFIAAAFFKRKKHDPVDF